MFEKLFLASKSDNKNTFYTFWILIVLINASLGFLITLNSGFIGQLIGIIIWILIYLFMIAKIFYKDGVSLLYRKALLWGLMIRTFYIVISVPIYLITYIVLKVSGGSKPLWEISSFLDTLSGVYVLEIYIGFIATGIEQILLDTESLFITTIIHGGIATIFTFILGNLVFILLKIYELITYNPE